MAPVKPPKTIQLYVYVTPEQMAEIKQAADEAGRSMSGYVKQCVLAAVESR